MLLRCIDRSARASSFISTYLLCMSMPTIPAAELCNGPLTDHLYIDSALWRLCEVVFQVVGQLVDGWMPQNTTQRFLPRGYAPAAGEQVQSRAARWIAQCKARNIKPSTSCCVVFNAA